MCFEQQLMMHFIQHLSLNFHSFLVPHQLTRIGGIALARAIGSKISSFHLLYLLKAHMNLSGIQRLYGIME